LIGLIGLIGLIELIGLIGFVVFIELIGRLVDLLGNQDYRASGQMLIRSKPVGMNYARY
jgi:hypothetical protein